jgi:hypothetical protein
MKKFNNLSSFNDFVNEDIQKKIIKGKGWDAKEEIATVGNLELNRISKKLYSLFKKEVPGAKVQIISTHNKPAGSEDYKVGIYTSKVITGKDNSIKIVFKNIPDPMSIAKKYIPMILKDFPSLKAGEPKEITGWSGVEGIEVLLTQK